MKFHHVGIACKDIKEELSAILKIHKVVKQSEIVYDAEQDARLMLLTLEDGSNLELISGQQVATLVKKNITYYHICFEVNDLEQEIQRLTESGALLISAAKPAILFDNRPVAFLRVSYGIIELLESAPPENSR